LFSINFVMNLNIKLALRCFALLNITIVTISSFAQYPCGTTITEEQAIAVREFYQSSTRNFALYDDTVFVPIKPHIIRRSDGSGGLDYSKLVKEIDSANYFFRNAKIQFEVCDTTGYLNDTKYSTLDAPAEEEGLAGQNEVPRVINIYFVDTLLLNGIRVCGFSYLPVGPNRIFIDNACVNNGNTLAHELGHFFSLIHTHGSSNTQLTGELANGSNCSTTGDYICDTPADPNLFGKVTYSQVTGKCTYTGNDVDANGDAFAPGVENIMSYSINECIDSLTAGQYNAIRNSLFYHGRVNLICTPQTVEVSESKINNAFPNPFINELLIEYQLEKDADVTLVMYDVLGRRIVDLYMGTEEEGLLKQYAAFGYTKLLPGMYFIKLEVNGKKVDVVKLMKAE